MEFVIISSYQLLFLELLAVYEPNEGLVMLQELLSPADPTVFRLFELY